MWGLETLERIQDKAIHKNKKEKIMKVYVAEVHYDYEGFNLVGIYTTKKKAQKALDTCGYEGDEQSIEEYKINEIFKK